MRYVNYTIRIDADIEEQPKALELIRSELMDGVLSVIIERRFDWEGYKCKRTSCNNRSCNFRVTKKKVNELQVSEKGGIK